jgi:hypothetical protein
MGDIPNLFIGYFSGFGGIGEPANVTIYDRTDADQPAHQRCFTSTIGTGYMQDLTVCHIKRQILKKMPVITLAIQSRCGQQSGHGQSRKKGLRIIPTQRPEYERPVADKSAITFSL